MYKIVYYLFGQRRHQLILFVICISLGLLGINIIDYKDTTIKQYREFEWSSRYDSRRMFNHPDGVIPDLINITIKDSNKVSCNKHKIKNELTYEEIKDISDIAQKYAIFLKGLKIPQRKKMREILEDVNVTNVLIESSIHQSKVTREVCDDQIHHICRPLIKNLESNLQEKFILPFENFFKPFSELKHTKFFQELQDTLELFPTKIVHSIGITYLYIPSFINWMVVARQLCTPPIGEKILVYTQDIEVCEFLNDKKINVICLHYDIDELRTTDNVTVKFSSRKENTEQRQMMWIARVLLWRLVNYLGYDIVTFDTDALPIHHPSVVFDKFPGADLIGSQNGRYPGYLYTFWQLRTINMGVVLMRSSLNNTIFWDIVGKLSELIRPDDQCLFNLALLCLNTRWQHPPLRFTYTPEIKPFRYNEELNMGKVPIVGNTDYDLKVIGVQGHQICRGACSLNRLDDIIVWHKCAKHRQGPLWLLSTDWTTKDLVTKGDQWLYLITNQTSLKYIRKL
ncbi:unnamed protein product [Owenia fusiformis]|uniref:Nucleotide-diphospho-sugar transferase domain-containing protein n=1 Tax=Owenia fusiformis TaxID=6347 RepID=A0A8S4NRS7_OWEFU|nr:unnamed protein product [Owenia fusiformis]